MWDISYEYPILTILGILVVFYFSRSRLPIRRNRVFFLIIITEVLCIFGNIASTYVDNNHESYAVWLISLLNAFYFAFFFLRAYCMYLFEACVMKDKMERNPVMRRLIKIPLYAGLLISLFSLLFGSEKQLFCIFYVDESGYHNGNLYHLLYVVGFFYAFLAFLSSYLYRDKVGRRREKNSIATYNLIVVVSLITRFVFPNILLMDTFVFMAILVVYLTFENPEFYLDFKGATFNRLACDEYLEENLENIRETPLGISVHDFHTMRDIYGAPGLDNSMAMIGRYLKQLFNKGKVFYFGSGRFLVLDWGETEFAEKTEIIAERFRHPWSSETADVYLSVGFATFDHIRDGYALDVLLETITKALETAGETGGRHHFGQDELEKTARENAIRKSIVTAIEEDGLELYLQPIMDAGSGKIVGAEALSRIRDAEGNIIPPGVFIPVAESCGRINELGELIFAKTCSYLKDERLLRTGIGWINVNLSPAQFIRTDLAERYSAIVDRFGIDPAMVHLEITESSVVDDMFLQKQMAAMCEKGFRFALDDWGTGYSNLSRLKKCPFANVKLDMSLVWDFSREPDEILPNMVQAFKHMGFCVTAEGIEDVSMVDSMKRIGCDYLQGYHYSKPLPAEEFIQKYS